MAVRITLSPGRRSSPYDDATRLMASVVPRVNIISSVDAAPMNRLAASLAASIAAVASWESVWTPRCTLARKFV